MTTTLRMRDSTKAPAIPVDGTDIAAGYLNGAIIPADWAPLLLRFPGIPKVAIDTNGAAPGAQARDWEDGDKGGSLEQWVIDHNRLSGAKDAVIYANRSTIAEVRRLTGSQVLNKDYYLWVATLDNTVFGPDDLEGVIACQTRTVFLPGGLEYDESVVWPNAAIWWSDGVIGDPAPKVQPRPPAFSQPRNVTVSPGDSSVEVVTCTAPAHGPTPDHYEVSVFTGSFPSDATLVHSYPRFMRAAPQTFGSLQDIASGTHMTCRVVAVDAGGNLSAYTDTGFEMP